MKMIRTRALGRLKRHGPAVFALSNSIIRVMRIIRVKLVVVRAVDEVHKLVVFLG
jgi:hypothetical protein